MAQPILDQEQLDVWNKHVLSVYPEEAAALVVKGKVIPVPNTSETPTETFSIAVRDFWAYKDDIDAVLHSHTYNLADPYLMDKRVPSKKDLATQMNHNKWWGISATEGEEVTEPLWFGFDREEPYEGRMFIYNVSDCFELVRDYYRREYQHELPRFARDWNWNDDPEADYFEDNWAKEGFTEVDWADIDVGDVVMFNIASDKVNHVGVYIGNDTVLHHLYGRLSGTETLSKWRRQVSRIVRRGPKNVA